MGTEFWWFYDAVAAAIVLVCLCVSGKKGIVNSAVSLTGYAIAVIAAVALSASVGKSIYTGMIQSENVKKLSKSLDGFNISASVSGRISGETNRNVRAENVKKIYKSDKPYDAQLYHYVNNISSSKIGEEGEFYDMLHQCYATIIRNIVKEELSTYAAESAVKKVLEDPESFNELIPLLVDAESMTPAAKYIAENYTADAYTETIKLVLLMAFAVMIFLIAILVTRNLVGSSYGRQPISSHLFGAAIGIVKGIAIVFVVAAGVRLYVILGNDEMLFFNHDAIDKTYCFRYFYNFVVNKI